MTKAPRRAPLILRDVDEAEDAVRADQRSSMRPKRQTATATAHVTTKTPTIA